MQTKYSQSQGETISLVRLVLSEMGKHDAAFNPITYSVWYEHLAGINPALSLRMRAAIESKSRLDDGDMTELYAAHVADADAQATDTARLDLQRVLSNMAQSAAATGESARAYGDKLLSLTRVLDADPQSSGGALLRPQLSDCVDGTVQMRSAVETLQHAVVNGEREIERLQAALDRTRQEAVTDPLSKLRNRRGFDEAMRAMLGQRPKAGTSHGLIIFDIDHFKRVNDGHGHAVGDMVIEAVGQALARAAGRSGILPARIGGEEFAILVPETTPEAAQRIAESVCTVVRNMTIKRRGTREVVVSVTLSAGVAAWVPGDDPGSFLAAADRALYRSKEAGRDCVSVA